MIPLFLSQRINKKPRMVEWLHTTMDHYGSKHRKKHIKIVNAQLIMNFTILAKHNVINYKILDMNFYFTMCLCNVCETLEYKLFEV
jgi:hypothetical protein